MSQRNQSSMQTTSHIGRRLAALTMAMVLVCIYMTQTATHAFGNDMVSLDKLCVDGLVTSHRHLPVRNTVVTAVFVDDPDSVGPLETVSDANGEFSFELPAPGLWSFSIDLSADWREVTPAELEVQVAYGLTECVKIRFKVKRIVIVEVLKIDDMHTPQEGWIITAEPGHGNTYGMEQTATTGPDGIAVFELTPGEWKFSEQAPEGVVHWYPISPSSGVQRLIVEAPGPHSIRFKNYIKPKPKRGCIEVIKRDDAPDANGTIYGLPGWHIAVMDADDELVAQGYTDALGMVKFSNLPEGSYTVIETMQAGWEAVTPMIIGVELSHNEGECKQIEFVNRQVEPSICIEGYKKDEYGDYGIPGWRIDAKPVTEDAFDPDPVRTDGQGKYRIELPLYDKSVFGAVYEVCERIQDGWEAVGPTCYTVTAPKHAGKCEMVPDFVNRQVKADPPKPAHPPKKPAPEDSWSPKKSHGGSCSNYHVVRRGDGLYKIARMYGVQVQALVRANPWVRSQRHMWLYAGQKVCIP